MHRELHRDRVCLSYVTTRCRRVIMTAWEKRCILMPSVETEYLRIKYFYIYVENIIH